MQYATTNALAITLLLACILFLWVNKDNYTVSPDDPSLKTSIEAAMGRRTITDDTFPDTEPYLSDEFAQSADGQFVALADASEPNAYIQVDPVVDYSPHGYEGFSRERALSCEDPVLQYNQSEAFAEDFVNTRECQGAAKLNMQKRFALPKEWDGAICESHCPDHHMIGTRADSAGNLSICARDTLYDHVGWNAQIEPIDVSEREYYGLQGYSYKERTA